MNFEEYSTKHGRLIEENNRLVDRLAVAGELKMYGEYRRIEKVLFRLDLQLEELDNTFRRV